MKDEHPDKLELERLRQEVNRNPRLTEIPASETFHPGQIGEVLQVVDFFLLDNPVLDEESGEVVNKPITLGLENWDRQYQEFTRQRLATYNKHLTEEEKVSLETNGLSLLLDSLERVRVRRLIRNPQELEIIIRRYRKHLLQLETSEGHTISEAVEIPPLYFTPEDTPTRLHELLAPHFVEGDREELLSLLKGQLIGRKLLFMGNGNQLTEFFSRVRYNSFVNATKAELKNWICASFLINKDGVPTDYNPETVRRNLINTNLSRQKRICQVDWLAYSEQKANK